MSILKLITIPIIIIIVIYALFGLLFQGSFSYFNQYSQIRLTFINFLLPWFITIGLLIFGTIEIFIRRENLKVIWIILIVFGILVLATIKWQIEFLLWTINTKLIGEIIPILTELIISTYIIGKLILNIITIKKTKKTKTTAYNSGR